jgi:hypothetical protein
MFRSEPPAPPPPPEPAPQPPKHPLHYLEHQRILLALKPDGNKAIEGTLMTLVLDGPTPGYLIHGNRINDAVLHEINDQLQPVQTPLHGDIWIHQRDVLYLNRIPATAPGS